MLTAAVLRDLVRHVEGICWPARFRDRGLVDRPQAFMGPLFEPMADSSLECSLRRQSSFHPLPHLPSQRASILFSKFSFRKGEAFRLCLPSFQGTFYSAFRGGLCVFELFWLSFLVTRTRG